MESTLNAGRKVSDVSGIIVAPDYWTVRSWATRLFGPEHVKLHAYNRVEIRLTPQDKFGSMFTVVCDYDDGREYMRAAKGRKANKLFRVPESPNALYQWAERNLYDEG